MIERLLQAALLWASEITTEEEDSDEMKHQSSERPELMTCAGRTLPDNIRLWVKNLAVARSQFLRRNDAMPSINIYYDEHPMEEVIILNPIDPEEARRILDETLWNGTCKAIIEVIIQINRTYSSCLWSFTCRTCRYRKVSDCLRCLTQMTLAPTHGQLWI